MSNHPQQYSVLAATREAYQDELVPINQLLDAQGFLRGLAPLEQRRRSWEAWKLAHGLNYHQRAPETPFGLEDELAERLLSSEEIRHSKPLSHGDERAREAAQWVDRLFTSPSCLVRAELLVRIALTFDGLRTTSLRRQLVDVIGSHLIGLDDNPQVAYTGRPLTQQERLTACRALRMTHSPHALYYFEKFIEEDGRRYPFNPPREIGHYQTQAAVRLAVVRAVEAMLDDIDRNSFFTVRSDTWRMKEYVTDVGKLRSRLAELNEHLYRHPAYQLQAFRPLPLPADSRNQPLPYVLLWRQLTTVPGKELARAAEMLEAYATSGRKHSTLSGDASYVERSRQFLDLLASVPPNLWPAVRDKLTSHTDSWPHLIHLPGIQALLSGPQTLVEILARAARPEQQTGQRQVSFWGEEQRTDLVLLEQCARRLVSPQDVEPARDPRRVRLRAVAAAAEVLRKYRAVENPETAFADARLRLLQVGAGDGDHQAVMALQQRIAASGGPADYYQIVNRPAADPNRLLYVAAFALLSSTALGRQPDLAETIRQAARRHLVALGHQPNLELANFTSVSQGARRPEEVQLSALRDLCRSGLQA